MNAVLLPTAAFLLTTLGVTSCAGLSPSLDLPPPYTEQAIHVEVTGFYRIGMGTVVGVAGTATNTTETPFRTCMLHFDVLDKDGVKVSDAAAHTMSLAAGQKWKFQAGFTAPFATTFKTIVPGKITVRR